jgi:hypothetical protein
VSSTDCRPCRIASTSPGRLELGAERHDQQHGKAGGHEGSGFTEKTHSDYVRNVRAFAAFIGRSPDTATAEDLRRFQLHQTQTGMQPPSVTPRFLRC